MNIKSVLPTGATNPSPPTSLTIAPPPPSSTTEPDEFYTPEEENVDPKSAFTSQDTVAIDSIQLNTSSNDPAASTICPECPAGFPNDTTPKFVDPSLSNQRQLTPELIMRAEKEVNEKDSWRLRDIEALRDMLLGESSLKTPLDDSFLLRFLRARRFDYDGAFQLVCDYYRLHRSNPELFRPITELRPLFDANLLSTAAGRSSLDESVFLLRLGRWDTRKFSFDDILAAAIRTMEHLIEEDDVAQINGIVSIIDMAGFGWSHLRKFGPSLAKKCIFIMEKCLPIRIKTIYIINESTLADIGFAIIKPFMSEELHEKIQFCGSNLKGNVHLAVHPDLLPAEFSGHRGPMNSQPLYEDLLHFEATKSTREAGQRYGCVVPITPGTGSTCTPSCGSRYGSLDEPILGPNVDGTSPQGGDMKSIFRKSQTCNGYLFDYYNSGSVD